MCVCVSVCVCLCVCVCVCVFFVFFCLSARSFCQVSVHLEKLLHACVHITQQTRRAKRSGVLLFFSVNTDRGGVGLGGGGGWRK